MPKKRKPEVNAHIPIDQFGKDHWSLLGFIECLCVEHKGYLDDKRRCCMRTNPHMHPMHGRWLTGPLWKAVYATRLKNGQAPDHDDWNVIEDLEVAGLLKNNGSAINPVFKLTPFGSRICAGLRAFKAQGGTFATFDYARYDQVPA